MPEARRLGTLLLPEGGALMVLNSNMVYTVLFVPQAMISRT